MCSGWCFWADVEGAARGTSDKTPEIAFLDQRLCPFHRNYLLVSCDDPDHHRRGDGDELHGADLCHAGALPYFLENALRARRLMAIAAAFVGALIILRPGFRELSDGHLAMIAAAMSSPSAI